MNTTKEQGKDKLAKGTRHDNQQQNKTQTTRQEYTCEQETNKSNIQTNMNKHGEKAQHRRPSDNQPSRRRQQLNKTIKYKLTDNQGKEQEATQKRQQQQLDRSRITKAKEAGTSSDTAESLRVDETATRKAAETRQTIPTQEHTWEDTDDNTTEEEETMADKIREAWLKQWHRDNEDTSDEDSGNITINSRNKSAGKDDRQVSAIPGKQQDKQKNMSKRQVQPRTRNKTSRMQQNKLSESEDLPEEKGEIGQRSLQPIGLKQTTREKKQIVRGESSRIQETSSRNIPTTRTRATRKQGTRMNKNTGNNKQEHHKTTTKIMTSDTDSSDDETNQDRRVRQRIDSGVYRKPTKNPYRQKKIPPTKYRIRSIPTPTSPTREEPRLQPTIFPQNGNMAIGDNIDPIDANKTFRIYYQPNMNGISASKGTSKWNEINETMTRHQVAMFGLTETNIEWNKYKNQLIMKSVLRKHFKHATMQTSTTTMKFADNYKPGGTCIVTTHNWTGRILTTIADETGQGRWSGTIIRAHWYNIAIITAYRVTQRAIEQVGLTTAYAQQWVVMRQQGIARPEPRSQFITNIK
jgi:hypothetical protein